MKVEGFFKENNFPQSQLSESCILIRDPGGGGGG
jgi:hypothetical protein